jgi:hypothetical protein
VDVLLTDELAVPVVEINAVLETREDIDVIGVPVVVREALVLDVRVGVCEPVLDALEVKETDLVENDLGVDTVVLVTDNV